MEEKISEFMKKEELAERAKKLIRFHYMSSQKSVKEFEALVNE